MVSPASGGGAHGVAAAAMPSDHSARSEAASSAPARGPARRPLARVLWAGYWCCEPAPRNRLTSSELLRRRPWLPHSPSRWTRCRRARRTVFLLLSNDRSSLAGYALLVFLNATICISILVMLVASLPQFRTPTMTPEDADTLAVLNSMEAVTGRDRERGGRGRDACRTRARPLRRPQPRTPTAHHRYSQLSNARRAGFYLYRRHCGPAADGERRNCDGYCGGARH